MSLVLMINADLTHIHQCVCIHQLREGRDFVQDDLQLVSFFIHNSLEHKWQHYYQSNKTLINWAQQYLDFLSGQRFHLSLLSDGEAVCQDFGSSGDGHFEMISVLLHLRNALDVFTFLYQIIRKTWNSMQVMSNATLNAWNTQCMKYSMHYIKNSMQCMKRSMQCMESFMKCMKRSMHFKRSSIHHIRAVILYLHSPMAFMKSTNPSWLSSWYFPVNDMVTGECRATPESLRDAFISSNTQMKNY